MIIDDAERILRYVELDASGTPISECLSTRYGGDDEEMRFAALVEEAARKGRTIVRLCNHEEGCSNPFLHKIEGDGNGGLRKHELTNREKRLIQTESYQQFMSQERERLFDEHWETVGDDPDASELEAIEVVIANFHSVANQQARLLLQQTIADHNAHDPLEGVEVWNPSTMKRAFVPVLDERVPLDEEGNPHIVMTRLERPMYGDDELDKDWVITRKNKLEKRTRN